MLVKSNNNTKGAKINIVRELDDGVGSTHGNILGDRKLVGKELVFLLRSLRKLQ